MMHTILNLLKIYFKINYSDLLRSLKLGPSSLMKFIQRKFMNFNIKLKILSSEEIWWIILFHYQISHTFFFLSIPIKINSLTHPHRQKVTDKKPSPPSPIFSHSLEKIKRIYLNVAFRRSYLIVNWKISFRAWSAFITLAIRLLFLSMRTI